MRGKPDGIGVDSNLSTPPLEVWKLFASELLKRGRNMGDFATVSGKAGTEAEFLYRSHGFVGKDIWHILRSDSV